MRHRALRAGTDVRRANRRRLRGVSEHICRDVGAVWWRAPSKRLPDSNDAGLACRRTCHPSAARYRTGHNFRLESISRGLARDACADLDRSHLTSRSARALLSRHADRSAGVPDSCAVDPACEVNSPHIFSRAGPSPIRPFLRWPHHPSSPTSSKTHQKECMTQSAAALFDRLGDPTAQAPAPRLWIRPVAFLGRP